MKKYKIAKKDQQIVVNVHNETKGKNLVFVVHGLGGFKEQSHIQTIASVFKKHNYTVVVFDVWNSIGESSGSLLDATLTKHYSCLETVIDWAKNQNWYQEPFVLAGHSLGSAACILYADKNPQKVKALIPASAFISGEDFKKSLIKRGEYYHWQEKGIREWESSSKPGYIKRLKWNFMEDAFKYNLLKNAKELNMPTLLIVGEKDKVTPPALQRKLFQVIPAKNKQLEIIKNSEHTYSKKSHLQTLKKIIDNWLKNIHLW